MSIIQYYKNIKSHKSPLKFICAKILMILKISPYFIIKQKNYNLRFYPTKMSRELWIDPTYWERNWTTRHDFFSNYLRSGDTVIDIGSHIGQVTLDSAIAVGISGKVYSIEPHPTLFKYLKGNVKLNKLDNVKFYNIALGETNSTVKFLEHSTDPSSQISSKNNVGIDVPIKKLDNLDIKEEKISLLKLHVVGFEKFVLLGGIDLMKKIECIHFREYSNNKHKADLYGYDYSDIFDILNQNNFKIFKIKKDNTLFYVNNYSSEEFNKNEMDYVAIKNLDTFLERTKFKIQNN